jgi:CheY-like chemotaxis protein
LLRATIPTTIEIKQDIASPDAQVLADPTQMQQLIMNLCTNAAQAMREKGGILEVRLEEKYLEKEDPLLYPELSPGPFVIMTVSDTGNGIAPEIIDRIFDPFFTTKEVGEGTGMGLAVVYGIVKAHGGGITIAGQPGAGASFTIVLPRIAGTVVKATEAPAPIPRGQGRLLIVDDETMLVDMSKDMLGNLGYEVTAVNGSLEALTIFQSRPDTFDLIIADQTMPHLTGLQLAQEIRRLRPGIPIILCTGYSDSVSAESVQAAGINELLMKPVTLLNLGEAVCRALRK